MTEVPEAGELIAEMAKLRADFDQIQRDFAALQVRVGVILPVTEHVRQHWTDAQYWPAMKPTVIIAE